MFTYIVGCMDERKIVINPKQLSGSRWNFAQRSTVSKSLYANY